MIVAIAAFCIVNTASAQGTDVKSQMLQRTEKLLHAVENGVLTDLKEEEGVLRQEAANAKSQSMGNAQREAEIRARDEAMREKAQELRTKIDSWARSGEDLIQSLSADELNEAMAEARKIARYFGLDVENLGKLYELGKSTIKNHEFVLPNAVPPNKDESYARYFSDFFTFAHNREEELAKYRKEQQEWRVTLFKRVTLAYIRALLASTEAVPACKATAPTTTITIGNKSFPSFGCRDLVTEKLRAYVQAVQKIAEADAARFTAEAEVVIARQELTTDLAAGLPLVGDAMDFYNLYAGEDLAGRCLTRLDTGLTAIFAVIPFLPSGWATQAVKRMGLEDALARLIMFMAHAGEYSDEMVAGLSKRFGITSESFKGLREWEEWFKDLLMTEVATMPRFPEGSKWLRGSAEKLGIPEKKLKGAWNVLNREITLPGGVYDDVFFETERGLSNTAAKGLAKPVDDEAKALRALEIELRNSAMEREAQIMLRHMPDEVRKELLERSRKRLADNLGAIRANKLAAGGNPSEVIKLSHMVPDHLKEFMKEAEDLDDILLFRYVNAEATEKLLEGRGTKGMHIKGKSSDWGPQAGLIPVDQKFSKLGNPNAPDAAKIAEFSGKVKKCVDAGICQQTELVMKNGDEVMVWKGIGGEVPVIKRGDKYLEYGTDKVLNVNPADTTPMMVLAEVHPKTGKLEPITADYDLLGVGSKADVKTARDQGAEGMISEIEREAKDRLNKAGKRAGYEGGDLVHHGGEVNNPYTPGALAEDPHITVLDPEQGFMTIPRCERDCMEKWCKTTGQCGSLPLCTENNPRPPCMMIDPDRLLKDYMNDARLRGYTTLRPNAGWEWGEYNGIAGWSPKVLLDTTGSAKQVDWEFGQYVMKLGVQQIKRRGWDMMGMFKAKTLKQMALEATEKLFSCPGQESMTGAAQ